MSFSVRDWTVEMNAEDGSISSVSWILLYRASLSGYRAADFHQACDGMGKCVVKAESGRVSSAYNEDSFTSVENIRTPNLNGFIVCVDEGGGCGEIFHKNCHRVGVWNHPDTGSDFGMGFDLQISSNCHQNEESRSRLGGSYGRGLGLDNYALFGQHRFRVVDYEVFKIVVE
jgi:hypothetical protein